MTPVFQMSKLRPKALGSRSQQKRWQDGVGVRLALFQHVKVWASEGQDWEEGNRKFVRKNSGYGWL